MSKIKALAVATEITPATVFAGATGTGENETFQYPFSLMQSVIREEFAISQFLKPRAKTALLTNDQYLSEVLVNFNPTATSVSCPNLLEVDTSIFFEGNDLLTSISMPLLVLSHYSSEWGSLFIKSCAELLEVNLASLSVWPLRADVNAGSNLIYNNPKLTTIIVNPVITTLNVGYVFLGNALTQATVDNILAALDAGGDINKALYIEGGTNAAPGSAGLASKANLVAKGWTVTHN